jgi:hypothetical protein
MMDRNFEPVEQTRRKSAKYNLFRTYDDKKRLLTFLDEEYEIEPVQRALIELHAKVRAEMG